MQQTSSTTDDAALAGSNPLHDVYAYWHDAFQRWLLLVDTLHQRGTQYREHAAKTAPHVLKFGCDLVLDGSRLKRPVNYVLVRVRPPAGTNIQEAKRPFVIVDPRAGHGPGIGGFKADSELGVAFNAGHPCYFIGFLPEPVPGQTIEDIAAAEAAFIQRVIELHPRAAGKPAVIGNCQAGWAVMMVAARHPELFGPIILAGSPLAYWAGERGANPMRYTGGLLGGSWLTALTSDLGNGRFDGAWLVANFENLNPANTLWSKQHNLYAKIDTEAPRYLDFEQWWGAHVLLNAEEMQFIADELFVGNKLAAGSICTTDGARIDLRSITSPIVVFCSKADNITPPQQALNWILDLYQSVDDIRAHGQTIVYVVHPSVGHLGLFVSGSVAKKEHDEFASNIDLIDVLPPGLYEAVMVAKSDVERATDLVGGNYMVRFEERTLDDIRELGGNDADDERMFETAARVSDINLGMYRAFAQPFVRACANEGYADMMRRMHPLRLQYELFSDANPWLRVLEPLVASARAERRAVDGSNALWQAQEVFSDWIEATLDAYRDARDQLYETTFHTIYGSPILQALVGLNGSDRPAPARANTAARTALVESAIEDLRSRIADGGPSDAAIRALLYVRGSGGSIDERGFNLLRRMREEAGKGMSLIQFKEAVREQFLMLLIDEPRGLKAIPSMLARDPALATRMRAMLRRMLETIGIPDDGKARVAELRELLQMDSGPDESETLPPRPLGHAKDIGPGHRHRH